MNILQKTKFVTNCQSNVKIHQVIVYHNAMNYTAGIMYIISRKKRHLKFVRVLLERLQIRRM